MIPLFIAGLIGFILGTSCGILAFVIYAYRDVDRNERGLQ